MRIEDNAVTLPPDIIADGGLLPRQHANDLRSIPCATACRRYAAYSSPKLRIIRASSGKHLCEARRRRVLPLLPPNSGTENLLCVFQRRRNMIAAQLRFRAVRIAE